MGSAVVEILNDMFASGKLSIYPKIKRIAIPDEFVRVVGTQKYLREVENLHLQNLKLAGLERDAVDRINNLLHKAEQ